MIKFILLVNKQGHTRFSNYYDRNIRKEERGWIEAEIVRKCLTKSQKQVHKSQKSWSKWKFNYQNNWIQTVDLHFRLICIFLNYFIIKFRGSPKNLENLNLAQNSQPNLVKNKSRLASPLALCFFPFKTAVKSDSKLVYPEADPGV